MRARRGPREQSYDGSTNAPATLEGGDTPGSDDATLRTLREEKAVCDATSPFADVVGADLEAYGSPSHRPSRR